MDEKETEESLLKKIQDTRGFVESFHRILARYDPEALKAYSSLWELNFKRSRIDLKTAALIRLAVVSALRDTTAVSHSFDQAVQSGANITEIIESLKIAAYFSGILTLVDSMKTIEEKLDR